MALNWSTSMQTLSRKVRKSLEQRGTLATAKRFVTKPLELVRASLREMSPSYRQCRAAETEYDRLMCVETCVNTDPGWLAQIRSANWMHGVGYAPVPIDHGRSIVAGLDLRYEDHVFIDLGAGKGRMLFLSSEFPFRRIVGVEYSPNLYVTLQRNLKTYCNPAQRCFDLRGLLEDAAQFELPKEPLVLFFHHPFGEIVFGEVVARIEQSLEELPRNIRVIYYDPVCGDLFENSKYFKPLQHGERDRTVRYASPWTVYGTNLA